MKKIASVLLLVPFMAQASVTTGTLEPSNTQIANILLTNQQPSALSIEMLSFTQPSSGGVEATPSMHVSVYCGDVKIYHTILTQDHNPTFSVSSPRCGTLKHAQLHLSPTTSGPRVFLTGEVGRLDGSGWPLSKLIFPASSSEMLPS